MRSGAAVGHSGYFHETAFYGSDDEFVAIVIPFLSDGLVAGEPTLAALSERNEKLVRSAMADSANVTFMPVDAQYSRPAAAIKKYRSLLAEYTERGAQQIRIVGDVPHPGIGAPWDGWARYEAAINHVFEAFPLWGLCPYDTRITPSAVLADVRRTHPHVATNDGRHTANDLFEDPTNLLVRRSTAYDALEAGAPVIQLTNPTPAAARHAVQAVAHTTRLGADDVSDMVFAASEGVTNALYHGRPPIVFRLWADADHMVVTVTDKGRGPANPFTGLLPATSTSLAGLGLWIAHNVCSHVALDRSDDGFTVRLIVGQPDLVA